MEQLNEDIKRLTGLDITKGDYGFINGHQGSLRQAGAITSNSADGFQVWVRNPDGGMGRIKQFTSAEIDGMPYKEYLNTLVDFLNKK